MVKQVVEHGQWNRENRIKHSAVVAVHPLETSSVARSARELASISKPVDKYPISVRGRTISLAGKPKINASRITPSSPISRANGSREEANTAKRGVPEMPTLPSTQIITPAGAATKIARHKTNNVRSKMNVQSPDRFADGDREAFPKQTSWVCPLKWLHREGVK